MREVRRFSQPIQAFDSCSPTRELFTVYRLESFKEYEEYRSLFDREQFREVRRRLNIPRDERLPQVEGYVVWQEVYDMALIDKYIVVCYSQRLIDTEVYPRRE